MYYPTETSNKMNTMLTHARCGEQEQTLRTEYFAEMLDKTPVECILQKQQRNDEEKQ